jgi:hypothetical protein
MKYLLIALLIISIFSQTKKYGRKCYNPYHYSYSNFVLTWPGDLCRKHGGKSCDNGDWYANWDGYSLILCL